jgi:pimeloyl-ACP methyl ester carboxylesterase
MPTAPVNGIDLYYESYGEGPAIVFAHGLGGSHLSWWQQVPQLSKRYRCITIDHRGFGQSPDTPDGPGRKAFAEDLRQLLDHLGIADAYLVGQSMGGWTVLGFALAHPGRTRGLVLADTTGGIAEDDVIQGFIDKGDPPKEVSKRGVAPDYADREPEMAFLYGQIAGLNRPPETTMSLLTSRDGPKAKDLAGFKVPTLFLVGAEDVVVTPEIAHIAQRYIPDAAIEIVPGCGHSVYFEKPAVFNGILTGFFERVGA